MSRSMTTRSASLPGSMEPRSFLAELQVGGAGGVHAERLLAGDALFGIEDLAFSGAAGEGHPDVEERVEGIDGAILVVADHVVAAAGDDDAFVEVGLGGREPAHVGEVEDALEGGGVEVEPIGLVVLDDAHAGHAGEGVFALKAAVHDVGASWGDGFDLVEAFEGVEEIVDGGSALDMGGELPAAVSGGGEDRVELVGLDEESAAGVGVGLAVELAAEGAIGHALVGGADGLAAVEGDFEGAELESLVAEVGGPG